MTKKKRMSGTALRRLRLTLEWTQARLAEELGVDAQTISNWERGIYEVPLMAGLAFTHLACCEPE